MDIFNKPFEKIFTQTRLLFTLIQIKTKIKDYEEMSESINSGKFLEEIQKGFIPKPVIRFEIQKNEIEKRELILASTPSKIVQKILSAELNYHFKFSNKVYAYRQGRGTIQAIKQTKEFLQKYQYIIKADIDSFFDSINVDILQNQLQNIIKDKKILKLIILFLQNGSLKQHKWLDKTKGIYQGDNLSPILSNLYLDEFDCYLESKNIDFIRYADDMVLFAKNETQAKEHLNIAKQKLNRLKLHFGEDKTYIAHINKGFEYLGIRFQKNRLSIDNKKLQEKISKLSKNTKNLSLIDSIIKINEHIEGVKNYYLKIIDDYSQFLVLQKHINEILTKKIIYAKEKNTITNKTKFKEALQNLKFYGEVSQKEKNDYIDKLLKKAYEKLSLKTPITQAKKEITKSKKEYLTNYTKSSEIILNKHGLFAGVTKGKIVVKESGKVLKKVPLNYATRIVVQNRGTSFSSALIFECSKRKIDIDFIDKLTPYAILTYHQTINNNLHLKQLKLFNSPKALTISKEIVSTKSKNQINLLKYFARYKKTTDMMEYEKIIEKIGKMETIYKKIKIAKDNKALMGYEGVISSHYWNIFGLLIGDKTYQRVTKDAKDEVNQALNYGYAIIYNRIQSALIHTGLNIYYSIFHKNQPNKPTLVYDLIEEFRQPIVDREIISILNRGTKLKKSKHLLSEETTKIIIQNIQERLSTPSKSRYGKMQLKDIIQEQANLLKRAVDDEEKYKGFVARFF